MSRDMSRNGGPGPMTRKRCGATTHAGTRCSRAGMELRSLLLPRRSQHRSRAPAPAAVPLRRPDVLVRWLRRCRGVALLSLRPRPSRARRRGQESQGRRTSGESRVCGPSTDRSGKGRRRRRPSSEADRHQRGHDGDPERRTTRFPRLDPPIFATPLTRPRGPDQRNKEMTLTVAHRG